MFEESIGHGIDRSATEARQRTSTLSLASSPTDAISRGGSVPDAIAALRSLTAPGSTGGLEDPDRPRSFRPRRDILSPPPYTNVIIPDAVGLERS